MRNFVVVIFLASCFFSCNEKVAPGLDLGGGTKAVDSSYTAPTEIPQQKKVLIEEVTGVGCVGCPEGARTLKSIIEQNGGNAYLVALHTGGFSLPYNESKYDFRNNDADEIVNFLGFPKQYPMAAIDRIPNNDNEHFLSSAIWSNRITDALKSATPLNIHITSTYNEKDNEVEVVVKTAFTEDVEGDLNLFVYIIEDNIIDFQIDNEEVSGHPKGYVFDYEHNHVFRESVTNVIGDPLNFGEKKAGNVLQKRITFNPIIEGTNKWNLDNCHIVAFVGGAGSSREVIHTQEIKLE